VTVTSLTITESGLPANGNILSITLLKNGVPDGPSINFSGSTATFTGLSDVIAAGGGSATYTIQVNFVSNAATGSYSFSLTGGTGSNGQPVNFNPLPVTGANITIVAPTATPTATFTPTKTSTPLPTNTPTPFEDDKKVVVYPNPSDGGPVEVLPPPYTGTSDVQVMVFTTAFRKVQEKDYTGIAYAPLSVVPLDDWGNPLASGLYYVVIYTKSGKSVGKLLVLR
jgi:hypothetical protein